MKKNFFDDMMEQDLHKGEEKKVEEKVEVKVETQPAPVKEAKKSVTRSYTRTMKAPLHSTAENSKTYLFRTTPQFFNQLRMFGQITKQSLNTIIETALLEYLDRPENRNSAKHAEDLANKL